MPKLSLPGSPAFLSTVLILFRDPAVVVQSLPFVFTTKRPVLAVQLPCTQLEFQTFTLGFQQPRFSLPESQSDSRQSCPNRAF